MKKSVLFAVLVGILASSASYYIWCSWQWKQAAAEASELPAEESETTYAVAAEGVAPETAEGTLNPNAPSTRTTPGASTVVDTAPLLVDATTEFQVDGTVRLDARVGQKAIFPGRDTRINLLLTANGAEGLTGVRPPVNLTLVLDRSGSMRGDRIDNAKAAAKFLVSSLQDGDRVSVVSYDTTVAVDRPTTVVSSFTRSEITAAIDGIQVGGDTCISCGMSAAREQMLLGRSAFAGEGRDPVSRVVMLSDGKATAGVRDVGSLAQMARDTRADGAPVTTIGVGLGYNETLLSEMAVRASGNHHFVEDPGALQTTLASELSSLESVVARDVVATLQLSPGVRLEKIFDREHEQRGNTVTVLLDDLSAGDENTVLAELAVLPGLADGVQPLASVSLSYRDVGKEQLQRADGVVETRVTSDANSLSASLDPLVEDRVEQAKIREAILRANEAARQGNIQEAQQIVQAQQSASSGWSGRRRKKSKRASRSLDALESAGSNFDMAAEAPEPANRQRATKGNAADSLFLAD